MERVAGPFAKFLEREREQLNARFREARHFHRHLDSKEFLEHLATVVAPVVDKIAKKHRQIDTLALHLYTLSLELMALGCVGNTPRYPVVKKAWEQFFPKISLLLAKEPLLVASSTSNALLALSKRGDSTAENWLQTMDTIVSQSKTVEMFLQAGQVAAWHCGLPQYRLSAIEVAENLPDKLLNAILQTKNIDFTKHLPLMKDNPWHDPLDKNRRNLKIVYKVGGFRGFGGIFLKPPKIKIVDDDIFVYDSESYWLVHADSFGTFCQRMGKGKPPGTANKKKFFSIDKNGKVTMGKKNKVFAQLKEGQGVANEHTLAVSLPHSHYIHLIAYC